MRFPSPKFLSKSKRTQRLPKMPAVKVAPRPVVALDPIPLPGNLTQRLDNLRRWYRTVNICTGLAMLLCAASLLLLVQGVSDWWFDLPWFARAGFLLTDLAVLGYLYRLRLDGALRKRLGLGETALLVEKKWPQLKQSVIAAVELTQGKPYSTRGSRQLVDVVLQQAQSQAAHLNFKEVVSTRMLRRWVILSGASILVTVGVAIYAWPSSVVLLERLLLLNVPLPTKTIVVPITRDLLVPVGSTVEIRAKAQGVIPTHGRVTVTYVDGAPQEYPVTPLPDQPDTFSFTMHNLQTAFKYRFYLNDGHGPEFSVTAKVPPSVTNVACEQIFPDYTGFPVRKLAPTELSILVGSHLKVSATATAPLKSAKVILQGVTQTIEATIDASGTQVEAEIPIPAKDLTGFSIHLIDQEGVSSANETIYPIVLVPDNPPVVKIVQPVEEHETITLRAKPVITFDASDDYGVTQLTLNYQLIPPMQAGQEDSSPPSAVQSIPIKINPAKQGNHYQYVLDVAGQNPAWQEGYTVNYWVEATDNNTVTGPGLTKTDHKQFSIISVEAKQAEILDRLKQNANEINSLSDTQQKINNDVGEAIPQK